MFKHIIYHKACPDGFGSAYVAWKVLGDDSAYIPQSYYEKPPIIKDSSILVCDFSFNYDTTMNYINNNSQLNIGFEEGKESLRILDNLYVANQMNNQ